MNPTEWMAALISVIIILKFAMFFTNKKAISKARSKYFRKYANQMLLGIVVLLAAASFYIFQAFTIVEVMAVTVWVMLLIDTHLLAYPKATEDLSKTIMREPIAWPGYLWILLAIWCLKVLFF